MLPDDLPFLGVDLATVELDVSVAPILLFGLLAPKGLLLLPDRTETETGQFAGSKVSATLSNKHVKQAATQSLKEGCDRPTTAAFIRRLSERVCGGWKGAELLGTLKLGLGVVWINRSEKRSVEIF